MLRQVRSLLPAVSLLAPGVATSLRALSTQAHALTSLSNFSGLLQQGGAGSLAASSAAGAQGFPLLLGQHALLPETARALAELQAQPAVMDMPASLDLGLTIDEPSPAGGADPWLCHTKRTFNPSLIIRKRRHGFLSRISNRGGRKVIARRRAKGRWRLTA